MNIAKLTMLEKLANERIEKLEGDVKNILTTLVLSSANIRQMVSLIEKHEQRIAELEAITTVKK